MVSTLGDGAGANLQDSGSLRERKHDFMLREIERSAWELFETVGFHRATVQEISRRAGVSRRTFFRYFPSKEALLSYTLEQCGQRIAERFAAMPAKRDPIRALQEAMLSAVREEIHDTRQPKEMIGLMLQEPHLRGYFLYHMSEWAPLLSREMVQRKAFRGNRSRCELAAALHCTAFDQAHLRWYREPNTDLVVLLKSAFRQVVNMKNPGTVS